jgi:hypothetical protein
VREARSRVRREQALGELNELEEIGAITEMEYDKAKRDLYGLPAKNIALHQQILARICSIRHLEKEIQKEAGFIFNEINDLPENHNKTSFFQNLEKRGKQIAEDIERAHQQVLDTQKRVNREITAADIEKMQDPLTTEVKPISLKQQITNAEIKLISFTQVLNELNDDDEDKAAFREEIEELTTTIADLKARIVEVPTDETLKDYYTQYDIDSNISIIDRMKNKIKNITETLNDLADWEVFHYYNNDWYDNEELNPLSPENWPLGWGVEGEGSQVCVNIATFDESKLDDVMFAIAHIHGEKRVLHSLAPSAEEGAAYVSLETSNIEETVKQLTEELQIAQAKNKQIIAEKEELKKDNELLEKLYLDEQKKQKRMELAKKKGIKGVTNFLNHVAKPQYKIYCEKTIKNQSINGTEHLEEFLTDKECMKNIEDEMKYTMEEEKINMEMPKNPKDKKPWENSAWINMQREALEELGIKKIGQSSKRK